jgi:teichuronic acid biosynthesis glycosyltransferase TuaH
LLIRGSRGPGENAIGYWLLVIGYWLFNLLVLNMTDIIIFALPRWDGLYSSTAFSLAKELARNHRVFYVDNPFTWKDVVKGFRSKQVRKRMSYLLTGRNAEANLSDEGRQLYCITPPPMLPVNFLPAGAVYNQASGLNDRVFFRAMKKLIDRFNIRNFIFVNVYNPFYGREFPSFFKPRMFIYYSVDNIGQSSYVSRHGPRLEAELMRKADLALTTSRELWNQARLKGASAFYLPNAADTALFIRRPHIYIERPEEFRDIDTPIIIYTGHIDVRVDLDLVRALLGEHPDKTLVMVGPHSLEPSVFGELSAFPNMRFLGRRDLSQLPAYLYYSHCAIIPFKCNELTRSIYPLKVNEYLAAGLPVVSTAFSEDIQGFSDVIEIGESHADFCNKISTAISDDDEISKNQRVRVASGNNWENRAQRFWEIVGKFTNDNSYSNSIAPMS